MRTFSEALRTVTSLPGALYSCVTEQSSGTVLAEDGTRPPGATPVLGWGRLVTESLAGHGDLEDLTITEVRHYHLLRRIRIPDRGPLLVYLHLDRSRANLGQARLALSTLGLPGANPGPEATGAVPPQALPPREESIVRRSNGARLPTRRPGPRPASSPASSPVPSPASSRIPSLAPSPGRPTVALAPASHPALPGPVRPAPGAPAGAVPLPRQPEAERTQRARADADVPGPDLRDAAPEPSPAPAGGWSTDLHTMRRLLDALRRLDES
ncbi:hypothetical protein [Pseudonocardia sp. KRD291]|uniref:hypothetical protein n=1 Tax=Pseudonocardia sp. KRD291 TaxID=2792007 RepID=UPI001C4A5588|nr:hypothetical protein [Pseudonocardia sp. KRD291]MBW0104065.1 hypothetical protein [Pseudonocardia sp. KRD291]